MVDERFKRCFCMWKFQKMRVFGELPGGSRIVYNRWEIKMHEGVEKWQRKNE
ncbi:hypothetical protein [uncultured Clostridium sp.]|uniref:hypothetical protein n=1 Tax=uncultured Clostridium sp. TaxID=59620 RepID=UPI0025EB64BD|nr:hypothetical protein [uncultured Clostridium sp.]